MVNNQIEHLRDTQIIIDTAKIGKNMKLIKDMVGDDVEVMAVVKANGYGHGATGIAQTLMESGAHALAVATLTEALELKKAYPEYPVFIMGHTPDRLLHHVVREDIIQTIFTLEQANILGKLAKEHGKTATVHVKLDTGFHRLGQMPTEEYKDEVCKMFEVDGLKVEGIFSHLALTNDEENKKQYNLMCKFIDEIEENGYKFKYKHIADSIATVDYPEYRMNMVRAGALIYGMRGFHKGFLPVEQAMIFRTAVSQLHKIKTGEGVSYDYLWKANRDSIVATLPFGYADGYPRNLRDKGYVVINGYKAPIIGVICMDQCICDVTDIPDVKIGSEAIIYGDGIDGSMTIDEASKLAGTNKNDIIARFTQRPLRIYI